VITSLVGFTALYGVLAVVEMRLMLRAIWSGLPEADVDVGRRRTGGSDDDESGADDEPDPLSFAY
jgi:cytochrome d ubiquinol oxidase subunit I